MPGIDVVAEGADVRGLERQLRDHSDAVITLLPVQRDVFVAEAFEALQRKCVVDAFGFLQAQHVRPRRFEEFGDDIDAQAHRIDIPGCQGEAHENGVAVFSLRHGRACPGHPRLFCYGILRTWMPGTRPGMTNSLNVDEMRSKINPAASCNW